MSRPITILGSFDRPVFQPPAPKKPPIAHISGTRTRESEPPNYLLEVNVSIWASLANQTLERDKDYLKGVYLPTSETGASYQSEGDVVSGSTLQLNHPVHVALQRHLRSLQHGSEVNSSSGSARADKVYTAKAPDGSRVPFAVLDYKNISVLNEAEFRKGVATDAGKLGRWARPFDDTSNKRLSNAAIVLKQATNYACQYGTPFVALYDMRMLVLLVLSEHDDNDGGEFAFVSFVKDPEKMRRAFLGFLRFAWEYRSKDEVQWKGEIMTAEQRSWFNAAKKPWSSGRKAIDKI